jgi:ketosteroid isomerase-like protein
MLRGFGTRDLNRRQIRQILGRHESSKIAILHTGGQVSHPAQTQAVDAVLATDRQLDRAWNDKDVDALDKLWADDYLFIGWTGEIKDKHERLAAIRSGKFQVHSVQSDEVKVRVFNDVAFFYRS